MTYKRKRNMTIHYRPTYAEVSLDALRFNIKAVKARLPQGTQPLAVVKANAYGHGALRCSRALEECGIRHFGVATLEEGIELRNVGIRGEVLVFDGLLSGAPKIFVEHRLRPVISNLEDLQKIGEYLREVGREQAVHLKFDTGMGRLGFLPSHIDDVVAVLKKYAEINLAGLMTHLARADEEDAAPTDRQCVLFERILKILEEKGVKAPIHFANSAAIIDRALEGQSFVRPGIMLYGAYPHPRHRSKIELRPVMALKSSLAEVRKVSPQTALGYGGTFVTQRDSLIGVLPLGYADGYPRLLSNKGYVLVGGKKAPVVGRISMDLTLVDLTEIPEAKTGDEVVLIGAQGEEKISAEDVANWADTISYEILCGISSRVPRIYTGL